MYAIEMQVHVTYKKFTCDFPFMKNRTECNGGQKNQASLFNKANI